MNTKKRLITKLNSKNRVHFLKKQLPNDELNMLRKLEKRRSRDRVRRLLEKKIIDIDYIIEKVAGYFNLSIEEIIIKTRKRQIVQPRQIAHYLCKTITNCSFAEIGKKIGGKNHATVLNSCRTITNLIQTDKIFREEINKILKLFF